MVQRRYSDMLADILDKKLSKCTCPPEYFGGTQSKKVNPADCCQFGPDCQFLGPCGANSAVAVTCQYNQLKCTCFTQCICSPQQLQGPEPEEDSVVRPSPLCNKTRCVCNVCLCKPDASDTRLLPTAFRNAVKKEPRMSTDDRIKQECAEIKQLLIEHEESKKKELEESTNLASEKINKKQLMTKFSIAVTDEHSPTTQCDNKEDKDAACPQEESKTTLGIAKVPLTRESVKTPKTSKKVSKKDKTPKKKPRQIKSAAIPSKPTTPSQFTQYSCGCRMPKKKPLHMRYYFSGGTEHYGVKLGHKQCFPKPALVPKNMGWLWNIEDPSKGIRERKGWPPGFIAKNIKNMIKVLKQFEDPSDPGARIMSRIDGGKKFRSQRREEGAVGAEPQEDPPLLHIHKKGRTYNITFCPKSSDTDIGPIPIPFTITEKKRDSESSSSDSTLEFEFHSPKPKEPQQPKEGQQKGNAPDEAEPAETTAPPPSTSKTTKKKPNKKRSLKGSEENKNLWEEQQTQMENIQ